MIRKIEFRASIAPIMSGIRIGADMMRLQLDIPKSDIQDAVPLLALTDTPLRITVEVDNSPVSTRIQRPDEEEKPKIEKKPKAGTDENGRYWQRMERPGNYYATPGLAEVLECEPTEQSVNAAIREAFNVDTRRQISPDKLEAWAEENQMANLITVSRTARAKL